MKLEKYLVLNKYLLHLFGVNDFRDLQSKLRDIQVGVDIDGRTYFCNTLRSLDSIRISEDSLIRYDQNIQSYVKKINYRRENVNLKYFQYLAVLFTEIILDNIKNRKFEFLYNLNEFLNNYLKEQKIFNIDLFTEADLKKLAFWMATGSGKTLIMHINYYQFLNYKIFSPDNIILITPNDELSKQHFEELMKSGIPCHMYQGTLRNNFKTDNEVLVIEITKFVEEKKGAGTTLPVYAFEGRNLIFVDEGHKGRRSEDQKWARLRNMLSENGFVFEYSATFGQILSENQPEILKEYSKSIIFDYSYKYFYFDGYGKDFSVLNIKQTGFSDETFQETMFIANLLSFYEQLLVYEERYNLAKEYNIEKPLWIFVGATVTGKEEESDVIQIVEFIKKVISEEEWLKERINKILSGNTPFRNEKGEDIFKDRFEYIKNRNFDIEDIYKKIFGGKGELYIYELKNAEGELGLKVGENDYFGVINIRDVSGFKKQLEKKDINVNQDVLSSSLFDDIKKENSKINILIGSKKFIEGWDTWRVTSMGLLNIGKGQGPQIIQLFGRGVRLKGKDFTLKRSNLKDIKILENLCIFGIKADYLSRFLEALNKEEVEFETIEIPIKAQYEDKWKELYILTKDEDKKFEDTKALKLEIDNSIFITLDLSPKLFLYQARERKEGIKIESAELHKKEITLHEYLDLIDWDNIYKEIYEFKISRNYWNLIFDKETLKSIILSNNYVIYVSPEIIQIKNIENIKQIENIAILLIKKYIDKYYYKTARLFEAQNLEYKQSSKKLILPYFSEKGEKYILQINLSKRKLIEKIKNLAENIEKIIKEEDEILPRIYFDKSLYLPILIKNDEIDKIQPEGLVESEFKFIKGLRDYLNRNKEKFQKYEIYLLRNFPKSGIGFQLKWFGFYPDFIMWVKNNNIQNIIFIDPKGLEHSRGLDDEKIVFAGCKQDNPDIITIKDIEKKLNNENIKLYSFILSDTSYNNLIMGMVSPPTKEDYIKNNVIFLEDTNWQELLFEKIFINIFPTYLQEKT